MIFFSLSIVATVLPYLTLNATKGVDTQYLPFTSFISDPISVQLPIGISQETSLVQVCNTCTRFLVVLCCNV